MDISLRNLTYETLYLPGNIKIGPKEVRRVLVRHYAAFEEIKKQVRPLVREGKLDMSAEGASRCKVCGMILWYEVGFCNTKCEEGGERIDFSEMTLWDHLREG